MQSQKAVKQPLPDIYAYSDYRSFLRDYAQMKREGMRGWSLSVWARQLKIDSRSMLSMVLNGGREPGPALVERLSDCLGLDSDRAAYFEALVRYEKSKNDPLLEPMLAAKLLELNPRLNEEPDGKPTVILQRVKLSEARKALERIEAELARLMESEEGGESLSLSVAVTVTRSPKSDASDD